MIYLFLLDEIAPLHKSNFEKKGEKWMRYAKHVFLHSLLSLRSMVFSKMASFRGCKLASQKESHLAPIRFTKGRTMLCLPRQPLQTVDSQRSHPFGFKRDEICWSLSAIVAVMCVCVCTLSHAWLLTTLWTILHQAPLSMEQIAMSFFRDLSDPGIEPASLKSPALAGGFLTTSTTWEAHVF